MQVRQRALALGLFLLSCQQQVVGASFFNRAAKAASKANELSKPSTAFLKKYERRLVLAGVENSRLIDELAVALRRHDELIKAEALKNAAATDDIVRIAKELDAEIETTALQAGAKAQAAHVPATPVVLQAGPPLVPPVPAPVVQVTQAAPPVAPQVPAAQAAAATQPPTAMPLAAGSATAVAASATSTSSAGATASLTARQRVQAALQRTQAGVKSAAGSVVSGLKRVAASQQAMAAYMPLLVFSLGTVVAVVEELDRQEREDAEKMAQFEAEQKKASDRLKLLEEEKRKAEAVLAKNKDDLQAKIALQQKEQEVAAVKVVTKNLAREAGEQQINLLVTKNLKELVSALKAIEKNPSDPENKRIQKEYEILAAKFNMIRLFAGAYTSLDELDGMSNESSIGLKSQETAIVDELAKIRGQLDALKDAFYDEMTAAYQQQSKVAKNSKSPTNLFSQAKIFGLDLFKSQGIINSQKLKAKVDELQESYKELIEFRSKIKSSLIK